jgi:hypothetical protein
VGVEVVVVGGGNRHTRVIFLTFYCMLFLNLFLVVVLHLFCGCVSHMSYFEM